MKPSHSMLTPHEKPTREHPARRKGPRLTLAQEKLLRKAFAKVLIERELFSVLEAHTSRPLRGISRQIDKMRLLAMKANHVGRRA